MTLLIPRRIQEDRTALKELYVRFKGDFGEMGKMGKLEEGKTSWPAPLRSLLYRIIVTEEEISSMEAFTKSLLEGSAMTAPSASKQRRVFYTRVSQMLLPEFKVESSVLSKNFLVEKKKQTNV